MSWNSAGMVYLGNDTRRMGRARWVEIGRRSHPAAEFEARRFQTRRGWEGVALTSRLNPVRPLHHLHSYSRINTCLTRERKKTRQPEAYLVIIFWSFLCLFFSLRYLPGTVTISLLCWTGLILLRHGMSKSFRTTIHRLGCACGLSCTAATRNQVRNYRCNYWLGEETVKRAVQCFEVMNYQPRWI